jgi:hypothetical protein
MALIPRTSSPALLPARARDAGFCAARSRPERQRWITTSSSPTSPRARIRTARPWRRSSGVPPRTDAARICSAEDHASLAWVCEAFADWEENYPMEARARAHQPGSCPGRRRGAVATSLLHPGRSSRCTSCSIRCSRAPWAGRLRLDRAGQMLEQRVERAVEKALEWFNTPARYRRGDPRTEGGQRARTRPGRSAWCSA